MQEIILGLIYAMLWSSASVAAKIGFQGAAPLTILDARFFLAGAILLTVVYAVQRGSAVPSGKQWGHLIILALCNSTIYLGFGWLALREVSAGIFALVVAANPFLVALMSSIWLKREVSSREWLGMFISTAGLMVAIAPALSPDLAALVGSTAKATASPLGILLTVLAVLTYAFGSVYFKWAKVGLPGIVINAWQIIIGAALLLPFAIMLNGPNLPVITVPLAGALLWSVFAVSIGAVLIWFYLLRRDPLRASFWLFLNPIFGYLWAWLFLGEPIHVTDLIGTGLVLAGLVISGALSVRATQSKLIPRSISAGDA